MGEYWRDNGPTEIEQTSLTLSDDVALLPAALHKLRAKHGWDAKAERYAIQIGQSAGYVGVLPPQSSRSELVYSPLYWDENADSFQKAMDNLEDPRTRQLLDRVRQYQGLPIAHAKGLVKSSAVISGLLPTPSITSAGGRQEFLFTPVAGVIGLDKQVLDNARAILACVRYGEHFAGKTKIFSPEMILEKLVDRHRGYRIGSHSEIADQYSILVLRGLGTIELDTARPGRYYFHLIPTLENIEAVRLAIDLLRAGEALSDTRIDEDSRGLLFQAGRYEAPLNTIVRYKRQPELGQQIQREITQDINDLLQGAIIP